MRKFQAHDRLVRDEPFERLATVELQDTSDHDRVDRLVCELREIVMGACKQRQVELYAAFRSDREDWVQSMVLASLGFALKAVNKNAMTR